MIKTSHYRTGGVQSGNRTDYRKSPSTGAPLALRSSKQARRKKEPAGIEDGSLHAVLFRYLDPGAREVFLAGDFNDWEPRATPMKKDAGGWSKELLLEAGDHEYRFIVDGQWRHDPEASRCAPNPFGSLNSVITIRED